MGDRQEQPKEISSGGGSLELPPGFRFYPSDEEIITFYLMPKVHQSSFTCNAIGEIDFNKTEPWELSGMHSLHLCILYINILFIWYMVSCL